MLTPRIAVLNWFLCRLFVPAVAMLVLLGGCATRIAASPSRSSVHPPAPAPDTWPPRDSAWADAQAALPPRDIDWFVRTSDGVLTDGKAELGKDAWRLLLVFGDGRIESSSRAGVGVVRDVRFGRPERLAEKDREDSSHHYTAFASRPPGGPCIAAADFAAGCLTKSHASMDDLADRIRSAGLVPTPLETQLALVEGMPFHLDPEWVHTKGFARPPEDFVPSRGIFFLVLGIGGADADDESLFDELSRRGWRIVLIPTGRIELSSDKPVLVEDNSPQAIEAAAANIAVHVDQRLAEMAYIVEGAADYLSRTHPELAGKPVAVFGHSAGALAAPAIAARLKSSMPGRLAALVSVCGGSNLLAIAHHSIVVDPDRLVTWTQGSSATARRRLIDAYLERSRLDPAVIGPWLRDVPTLIVKARVDWAIPSSATDRLYDDLGEPDWWSYLAGHESVLEHLADDRVRFADWLDAAADRVDSAVD